MTWFVPAVTTAVKWVGSYIMGNGALAAATLAAGGLEAYGRYRQGEAEYQAAQMEQKQAQIAAAQERAVGHRRAEALKRENARVLASQKTVLAASGFAADDPTSLAIMTTTARESSLEELLELAMSEDQARQIEYGGALALQRGRSARKAGRIGAVATVMDTVGTWGSRYGKPRAEKAIKPPRAG